MTDAGTTQSNGRLEAMPALRELYAAAARQAEIDVVGLIMVGALQDIEKIDPALFAGRERYLLLDAALRLHARGLDPDVVNVSELLDREGRLAEAGGLVWIADVARSADLSASVSDLIHLLKGFALMRFGKGSREGRRVMVPLEEAISVGALHGRSWVDDGGVRVCYAYLEPPAVERLPPPALPAWTMEPEPEQTYTRQLQQVLSE
jgi:hypothetical protein